MEDICQFIKSLGDLHDGNVLGLQWLPEECRFELAIEDIYANFRSFPEYKGPVRAKFVFSNVSNLNINVSLSETGILLYEWTVQKRGPQDYSSELRFSPAGIILVSCALIECAPG